MKSRAVLTAWTAAFVFVSATTAQAGNWGGFYVGLSAGFGGGGGDVRYVPPSAPAGPFEYSSFGAIYGGHAGFSWQRPSGWVFGVEASMRLTKIDGVVGCNVGNNDRCELDLDNLWIVNGRVGRTIGPEGDILAFATVGYAKAEVDMTRRVFPPAINLNPLSGSFDHAGYELGAGVEFAVAEGWTVGCEYQFVTLDDDASPAIRNDGASSTHNHKPSALSILQARVSYAF